MKIISRSSLKVSLFISALFGAATVNAAQVDRCAFVSNGWDYSVGQYLVQPDGELVANGHVYSVDKYPAFVIIHPNQRWAYVVSRTVDVIRTFNIDSKRCLLNETGPKDGVAAQLRSPFRAVFHPSGKFMYVGGRSGYVGAYRIDLKTGAISPIEGSPYKSGERTRLVVMHPSGKFIYATNAYTNNVSAFLVDQQSGALTEMPGSPFSTSEEGPFVNPGLPDITKDQGALPYYIAMHPNGQYAYVTNFIAGSVSQYRIDQKSGALSLIGKSVSAGINPFPIRVHPNGKFAYVATWGGNDVLVFRIDQKTGALTEIQDARKDIGGIRPQDLEFNPAGDKLYDVAMGSGDVSVLDVNPDTGRFVLRQQIHSRAGPQTIAFIHDDNYSQVSSENAFMISAKQRQVYLYKVDHKTGALSESASILTGKDPSSIAIDPRGRAIYVANQGDDNITIYNLRAGKLERMQYSPYATDNAPGQLIMDRNGWYLYANNPTNSTLQFFLLHKETGELAQTYGSPLPILAAADNFTVDVEFRYSYALHRKDQKVSYNRSQGAIMAAHTPQLNSGSPMTLPFQADLMLTDNTGRFILFADNSKKQIHALRIHPGDGSLHEIEKALYNYKKPITAAKIHPQRSVLAFLSDSQLSLLGFNSINGAINPIKQQTLPAGIDKIWFGAGGHFIYLAANQSQDLWILPITIENALDKSKIKINLGKLTKQHFEHDITDLEFSRQFN